MLRHRLEKRDGRGEASERVLVSDVGRYAVGLGRIVQTLAGGKQQVVMLVEIVVTPDVEARVRTLIRDLARRVKEFHAESHMF